MHSGRRIFGQPAKPVLMTLLFAALISFCQVTAANPETGTTITDKQRPKIGLVLSGGGARGFAHIGVLKKIEALRIPVDVVVGTSMGSIIGGLYATGLTPDEIEQGVQGINWELVFNDYARRDFRSFRRKQDDYLYASIHRIGVSSKGLKLSPGLIEGQQIELALDRLAYPGFHITDFDQLRIPYRAIATDIETGNAVIIDHGNLAKAMRASMSIPGALPPIQHEGRLLVDGGIGNNVPIDVARQMGADIVIVVDVSAPLESRDALDSSIAITGQLTTILTRRIADQQLETLSSADVLIIPGRDDLGSSSFLEYAQLIEAGLEAADKKIEQLSALSLSNAEYTAYQSGLADIARREPVIDYIEIKNQTRLDDEILSLIISQEIGQPLDVEQLERDLSIIYGLDLSSSVVYSLETVEGYTGLVIYVRERSWAPTYLQMGLALRSEFDIGSVANIDMQFTNPTINNMGGEFRTSAAIGSEPRLVFSVYQPLDKRFRYFVSADAGFNTYLFPEATTNNAVESLYRFQRNFLRLSAGRIFKQHTELRLSIFRTDGDTRTIIGQPSATDSSFDEGGYSLRLLHDSLDDVDFARSGMHARMQWNANREDFGSDLDFDQLHFSLSGAGSWGRYTVYSGAVFETTLDENAPENALFRRGGLFELSGVLNRKLAGQHFGLLEAAFYRRLGNITLLPMYAGFSIESGNVWNDRDDISLDNTILAGSVFVGADTLFGPAYLGFGMNDDNDSTLYLFLGRAWDAN